MRALNKATPAKAVAYVIKWLIQNAPAFQLVKGERGARAAASSLSSYLDELLS